MKRKGDGPKSHWQPLVRANHIAPPSEELIAQTMRTFSIDRETALEYIDHEDDESAYWVNDVYQVLVRPAQHGMIQLNIRRRDGAAVFKDWRDFQRIKNQLVGPECEGVEIYPAESRLTDTSNKYHIWCCPDPSFRFPWGFEQRDVQDRNEEIARKNPGLRQRRF
jgi:hypothetical protein